MQRDPSQFRLVNALIGRAHDSELDRDSQYRELVDYVGPEQTMGASVAGDDPEQLIILVRLSVLTTVGRLKKLAAILLLFRLLVPQHLRLWSAY